MFVLSKLGPSKPDHIYVVRLTIKHAPELLLRPLLDGLVCRHLGLARIHHRLLPSRIGLGLQPCDRARMRRALSRVPLHGAGRGAAHWRGRC